MFNIRKGVFETNSSSVHSLVIQQDDWLDDPKNIEWTKDNKKYRIIGGYYGRSPQMPIESTEEKLNYIWTMVAGLYGWDFNYNEKDKNDQWKLYIKNPEKYQLWQNMIHNICPNAILVSIKPDNYNCGIDHCYELENFAEEVEQDPCILRDFLLNYSWVDISGDEYANWPGILNYPYGEIVKIGKFNYLYVKGN